MKQRITLDQLMELSDRSKFKLILWLKENNYEYYQSLTSPHELLMPLLSIGQMIEFLGWGDMQFYQTSKNYTKIPKVDRGKWNVQNGDYENASVSYMGDSLCDALWEACKEVLEK